MNPARSSGAVSGKLIVSLVLGFFLFFAVVPLWMDWDMAGKSHMVQTLRDIKQLQLAVQRMAQDDAAKGGTNLAWPTDTPGSFSHWTTRLVQGGYLTTNELCHMLSPLGSAAPADHIPTTNDGALLFYAATAHSPGDTVILSSGNFTNTPTGGVFNPAAGPLGKEGFVVFHQNGDGVYLPPKQAGNTNAVGSYAPLCR